MISGALWRLNSLRQISPTLSRTFDRTPEIMASSVCSWLQPGLFSSRPFLARVIRSWHSAYAFATRASFSEDSFGPGMTSLIPREKP